MNEEEKKAVEEIRDISNYCNGMNCDIEEYESYEFNRDELDKLTTILNLIEKQQKEIKALKDKIENKIKEIERKKEILKMQHIGRNMIYTPIEVCNLEISRLKELLESEE